MSVEVELFTAPDYTYGERHALVPLLRDALRPVLGAVVDRAGFRLSLQPVDDEGTLDGTPSLVNLRPGHGYVIVTAVADGRIVYRHPHTVRELVGRPLQRHLARSHPDVAHWGYGLAGPGLEKLAFVKPVPAVEGQVEITAGRRRGITRLEELPEPEPDPIDLAGLGLSGVQEDGPVVLIGPDTLDQFLTQGFSMDVEEGGFVIGHRRRDPAGPGRDVLEITDVVPARSTGASLLRFTFTGESFLELANLLASRGRQEEVLGWYHTHLFAATDEFGLSSIDVTLHCSTFRRPWQVAALVNLGRSGRTLRFYHALPTGKGADGTMAPVPYRVTGGRPGADGTSE
ncbi:JAB N-terminal domain-containing protein [Actinoplanes derwentensis]|uniref:JAB-N domain-containing protein n=1 Tax=Actinoplanes derwentensis TaxID=113562 RepID=A0A1H2AII6_9ACTN|nr:JAB N-terminal domain-containing protein [Actinoplanes derwentensis]GID90303.1 hypothetical protein Ade03nite_92270 [Actinoplanes derwentensis]SDT45730.1 hypothetical protein SAMN04489716_3885 [Actinoplanes derwentensis]